MILKSTHFFQSLALGAEGGGGCDRDSTVHVHVEKMHKTRLIIICEDAGFVCTNKVWKQGIREIMQLHV